MVQAHNLSENMKHGICLIIPVKYRESGTFDKIFNIQQTITNLDSKSYIKLSFHCCPNQLCEHIIFGIGKLMESE